MHIPGTPHTVTEYIERDPDYKNCPQCKISRENNPDPKQFSIVDHKQIGDFLVLKVTYDNIKTERFELMKIIVYRGTPMDLLRDKVLDPHFTKDGKVVARFAPTDEGWRDAIQFTTIKKNAFAAS